MQILDSLSRWVKLGLFVGWGAGLALWSACSSTPAPRLDTPADLKRPPETRAADAGAPDAARDTGGRDASHESKTADQKTAVDKRAWDIPLE